MCRSTCLGKCKADKTEADSSQCYPEKVQEVVASLGHFFFFFFLEKSYADSGHVKYQLPCKHFQNTGNIERLQVPLLTTTV